MEVNPKEASARSHKQAACLTCRATKTKCVRDAGATVCKKCLQKGLSCTIPHHHVGRQKGTKNKRKGLEKAAYQVEQAIRRYQAGQEDGKNEETISHLQQILSATQNQSPSGYTPERSEDSGVHSLRNASRALPLGFGVRSQHGCSGTDSPFTDSTSSPREEGLPLNDAENPLQLLAHASHLSAAQPSVDRRDNDWDDPALRMFFNPLKPKLDTGPEIDPIDLGLVTPSEAEELFVFFYRTLSHTRWGLDPVVHSTNFVRNRSAFLFTSILSAAALFLPSAEALSKRLSAHCRQLAHRAMTERYRSVEVVVAFMVNVPWLSLGNHWADDETCSFVSCALTLAMDLGLHKVINDPLKHNSEDATYNITGSDSLEPRKALSLDGFDGVDPSSEWGRRLLRRRERCWLALFVLEKGVCLARGRISTVPVTPLIERCDKWHLSEIADTWDSSIVAMAVLRRDLVSLIAQIKSCCDSFRPKVDKRSDIVERIKNMINTFFDDWHAVWNFAYQLGNTLPPYVQILVSHTRLSTYGSVFNHPTASVEVRRFFRTAGYSSALNVMRVAVQGENELQSMPNNTVIMVAFAACFALRLHSLGAGSNSNLAPGVRKLVMDTAGVLERIGTVTKHRQGVSTLYGRQLRSLIRRHTPQIEAQARENQQQKYPGSMLLNTPALPKTLGQPPQFNKPSMPMAPSQQTIPFAFTDEELLEVIDNAEQGQIPFDMGSPSVYGHSFDSMNWMDLDWNYPG